MRVAPNNQQATWLTIGFLIAILVLVVDVVFLATGGIDLKLGLLIAGLAIARMT